MIDLDLTNPVNQVRVLIGDVNSELISDQNIQFLLDKHNGSVTLATQEALEYLVATVAYYVREESGDVEVYWGQIYDRLNELLTRIKKENLYSQTSSLFYFGGTKKSDIKSTRDNVDSYGIGFTSREFMLCADALGVDINNPYALL